MPVLGRLIRRALQLRATLQRLRRRRSPAQYQSTELSHLVSTAQDTAFGRHYDFEDILAASDAVSAFQDRVPVFTYDRLHDEWWYRTLQEEADVTWPGTVPYFALSSGTSGASSKHIPVTRDMVKALQRAGIRQIYSLAAFHLPDALFQKEVLMLGGSTALTRTKGYYVGDLSGITAAQLPAWFQWVYRPGPEIATQADWTLKLDAIAQKAPEWDVGIICGVPAWVQLLLRKIVEQHGVDTIHDVWPHLSVYVHGGVAFGPYRRALTELVARPLVTIETYVASEGYVAFQPGPDLGMQMLLNNGIFYEFVPFTDDNFDADGTIRPNATALTIGDVEEWVPYALLLSTCAGTWRYLLGDVIEFTDVDAVEIRITGRTKHFLNLCGEHLSGVNMSDAVERVEDLLGLAIPEFTVTGQSQGDLFAHHWYLGIDSKAATRNSLDDALDSALKTLNDDYRVERESGALAGLHVTPVSLDLFYDWMCRRGKLGGQNKFPRVLKAEQLTDWRTFLADKGIDISN